MTVRGAFCPLTVATTSNADGGIAPPRRSTGAVYRTATAVTRQLSRGVTVVMRSAPMTGFCPGLPGVLAAAGDAVLTTPTVTAPAASASAPRLDISVMATSSHR